MASTTGEGRAPVITLRLDKQRLTDLLITAKQIAQYQAHAVLLIAVNNIDVLLAGDVQVTIVVGFDLPEPITVDDTPYRPRSKPVITFRADIVASVTAAEISHNPIRAGQGQQLEFRFGLLTHFLLSTGIFVILLA